MELERNTIEALINYLKLHGHPNESFAVEYKMGKYRADLVIIDPVLKTPIMLFEVKSRKNESTKRMGIQQIRSYLSELKDESIPSYLVYPNENEPYFEVERISIDEKNNVKEEPVNDFDILNFEYQRNARITEKVEKNTKDKKKIVDIFKFICWVLAIIVLILAILRKKEVLVLDAIDMTFLGAFIGLIIMPFSSKLKILGMEFERLTGSKKE